MQLRKRIALASIVVTLCVAIGATYTIATPARAASTPAVAVSGYGAPTEPLAVSGTGFHFHDTVQISYDSTVVATARVNGLGGLPGPGEASYPDTLFSTQFTVPENTTTGTHTITATDPTAGVSAQTTVVIHANWNQTGFSPALRRFNPYETEIGPSNVSQLTLDWETTIAYQDWPRTITDGHLYTGGVLQELDATTGTILHTFANLPGYNRIARGSVVYGISGALSATDADSGTLLWVGSDVDYIYGGLNLVGGLVYVSGYTGLAAYNANGCGSFDCTAVWSYQQGLRFNNGSTPVIVGDTLYGGATDQNEQNAQLVVLNAPTGTLLWRFVDPYSTAIRFPSSPVVDNGYVFINMPGPGSATTLYAFNANGCGAATCSPLWSATNAGGSEDLAAANGVVYVGSQDDYLYAFSESGCGNVTCTPLWKGQAPGPITGAPAIANGVVYATVQPTSLKGAFLAFSANGCGAATCTPLWSYPLAYTFTSGPASPMVVNGIVYFYNHDSNNNDDVYAFHLPSSSARPGGARPPASGARGSAPGTASTSAPHAFYRCPRCE